MRQSIELDSVGPIAGREFERQGPPTVESITTGLGGISGIKI